MKTDYKICLENADFTVSVNGIWASVGVTARDYGWKIHVSSIQCEAPRLLEKIAPILKKYSTPFKTALNGEMLGELNEGTFGATQIGKFATIYPSDDAQAVELAQELVAATKGFTGPTIISDLALGHVIYTRFGAFNPQAGRDRLGNISSPEDVAGAGYTVPFQTPKGQNNPFDNNLFHQLAKNAGVQNHPKSKVISGYLLVNTLHLHPKGSVLLGLDIRSRSDMGLVVLKEGRRHCMSDMKGRDIWDRLQHQHDLAKQLPSEIHTPRPLALFDHGNTRYLVINYIKGRDFSQRKAVPYQNILLEQQKTILSDFMGLAQNLAELHRAGIVHRDLSPRNVRVDEQGTVWLMDLEMAAQVGAKESLFMQGTAGFISPQQREGQAAAFADDLYSFGCLLVNALTGMDPRRLSLRPDAEFCQRLAILSGAPDRLIALIFALLHETADVRPSLEEVAKTLKHCLKQAGGRGQGTGLTSQKASSDWASVQCENILEKSLHWMIHGTMRDEMSGMPLSPELESIHQENSLAVPQAYRLYRSASRGVSGVSYSVARLARLGIKTGDSEKFANSAADWLLYHHPTNDDQLPGLHFGEAGVALALSESVEAGLIETGPWFQRYMQQVFSGPVDWPDLTHGAAGQGLAALQVAHATGLEAVAKFSDICAQYLLKEQYPQGHWPWPEGVSGMSGTAYTGFAHGTAGILYYLSIIARAKNDKVALQASRAAFRWIEQEKRSAEKADYHWWPRDKNDSSSWHWWCHGGPGIAISLMAYFEASGDENAAALARSALMVHPEQVRHPNLSQCHGLAGLGEIYLEAWRVLGDDIWYDRAHEIGLTLLAMAQGDDKNSHWLVENPFHPTADLMIGTGGVALFIARLFLDKEQRLGMPLMPDMAAIQSQTATIKRNHDQFITGEAA